MDGATLALFWAIIGLIGAMGGIALVLGFKAAL